MSVCGQQGQRFQEKSVFDQRVATPEKRRFSSGGLPESSVNVGILAVDGPNFQVTSVSMEGAGLFFEKRQFVGRGRDRLLENVGFWGGGWRAFRKTSVLDQRMARAGEKR